MFVKLGDYLREEYMDILLDRIAEKCTVCSKKVEDSTYNVVSVVDLFMKKYPLTLEVFGDFYPLCKTCIPKVKKKIFQLMR